MILPARDARPPLLLESPREGGVGVVEREEEVVRVVGIDSRRPSPRRERGGELSRVQAQSAPVRMGMHRTLSPVCQWMIGAFVIMLFVVRRDICVCPCSGLLAFCNWCCLSLPDPPRPSFHSLLLPLLLYCLPLSLSLSTLTPP